MRHTEPTSCRREEQGNQQLQTQLFSHLGMLFQVLCPKLGLPPDKAESTSHRRIHIPQACSSLRTSLGGSPGPHVAGRSRQGEKKLAKALQKQNPAEGWQPGRAQHPAAASGTARTQKNKLQEKGKPQGCCDWLGKRTGRGCCWPRKPWGCAGLSTEGQSSGTRSRNAAPAPGTPKKSLTRRFSLNKSQMGNLRTSPQVASSSPPLWGSIYALGTFPWEGGGPTPAPQTPLQGCRAALVHRTKPVC